MSDQKIERLEREVEMLKRTTIRLERIIKEHEMHIRRLGRKVQ